MRSLSLMSTNSGLSVSGISSIKQKSHCRWTLLRWRGWRHMGWPSTTCWTTPLRRCWESSSSLWASGGERHSKWPLSWHFSPDLFLVILWFELLWQRFFLSTLRLLSYIKPKMDTWQVHPGGSCSSERPVWWGHPWFCGRPLQTQGGGDLSRNPNSLPLRWDRRWPTCAWMLPGASSLASGWTSTCTG